MLFLLDELGGEIESRNHIIDGQAILARYFIARHPFGQLAKNRDDGHSRSLDHRTPV